MHLQGNLGQCVEISSPHSLLFNSQMRIHGDKSPMHMELYLFAPCGGSDLFTSDARHFLSCQTCKPNTHRALFVCVYKESENVALRDARHFLS